MLKKLSFVFISSVSFLYSASNEAQRIQQLYPSLAKDFVIYNFIKDKNSTEEDAKYLYKEIKRPTSRLKRLFFDKTKDLDFVYPNRCKDCKYVNISPKSFEKLSLKKKKAEYLKTKKRIKKRVSWMEAIIAKDSFAYLAKKDGKDFLKLFFKTSNDYRVKTLNKPFPSGFLSRLANQKKFYRFVMMTAMNKKLDNLQKSLIKLSPKRKKLDFNTAFYLGLIALNQNDEKKALEFFKSSLQRTTSKASRDKARFWIYLTSKDEKALHELAKSSDLSFYTYLAREKLNIIHHEIITPKPNTDTLKDFNITDPFMWAKVKDDFDSSSLKNEFADIFYTKQTLPHYTYLKERANGFKKYYFIRPYDKFLNEQNTSRKILVNSLARQESRFVPASVSTSYALGFMQFMPFLVRSTAKENNITNFEYFDILKPENAVKFANTHLDFLEKYLHSPLFIAYAYNGGLGFTRSLFNKRGLFQKGKYEPYMSMELVHYSESRKYGKKVLLNYSIYSKIYDNNITLESLVMDTLNLSKSKAYKK